MIKYAKEKKHSLRYATIKAPQPRYGVVSLIFHGYTRGRAGRHRTLRGSLFFDLVIVLAPPGLHLFFVLSLSTLNSPFSRSLCLIRPFHGLLFCFLSLSLFLSFGRPSLFPVPSSIFRFYRCGAFFFSLSLSPVGLGIVFIALMKVFRGETGNWIGLVLLFPFFLRL